MRPPTRRGLTARRVVAGLASALLVLALATATGGAASGDCLEVLSTGPLIERVSGRDRYATAACASSVAHPDASGGSVVLARGDDAGGLADALAGTVLAHALGAPVLLTDPHALPMSTREEIRRLDANRVVVLGGHGAVGDAVMTEVGELLAGATVERVGGTDRHATAAAASAAAGPSTTAFLVNGFRPADALVAAAPAARMGAMMLLTEADALPRPTLDALDQVTDVVIVGGYGVVGASVESELQVLLGPGRVRRVSGGDRSETAASLARAFPASGRVHLVASADRHLVDAIVAGWGAALPGGGPVLFSDPARLAHGTDRYLQLGGLGTATTVRLVGGRAVLADDLAGVVVDRMAESEAGGPPRELRGVWAHLFDPSLKSPQGIDRLLDAAAAAHLNTVIVQVARRQDAYYASDVLPRTPDPDMPRDLDLLARLVPAARDRGLAVHAWISVLPAWHDDYAGLRLPIWEAHGAGSADPWVTQTRDGTQGTMLDPGVPAVVTHVAGVAAEIAGRYDVAAVHLDYVRYESQEWGYHPISLARFRGAHGLAADDVPAVDEPRWDGWRRRMTHDLTVAVRDAVRAVAPDVAISLAASTMGEPPRGGLDYSNTRTWHDVFQAWPDWLHAGVIDAAFPMMYFREATHPTWFDEWVAFAGRVHDWCEDARTDCTLAVGQASYLNAVDDSIAQLREARAATDGVVLYSYQQDSSDDAPRALHHTLATTLFSEPAAPPPLR